MYSSISTILFIRSLGASSGIGKGAAIYLAKNGAKLAITGRNEENLKLVAAQCEEISPNKEKVIFFIFVF